MAKALKGFTCTPRPEPKCQCETWARRLLPQGGGFEPFVNGHNPACPTLFVQCYRCENDLTDATRALDNRQICRDCAKLDGFGETEVCQGCGGYFTYYAGRQLCGRCRKI